MDVLNVLSVNRGIVGLLVVIIQNIQIKFCVMIVVIKNHVRGLKRKAEDLGSKEVELVMELAPVRSGMAAQAVGFESSSFRQGVI